MFNYIKYKVFSIFIFFTLLTACSHFPFAQLAPLTPKITLAGLKLREVNLLEQYFQLQLALSNPNSFALPIANLDYMVYVNGKQFFKGASNAPFSLPAKATQQIEIEVVTNLMDMFEQLRIWQQGANKNVNYRLVGGIKLTNWGPTLSFEEMGSVPLSFDK